MGTPTDDPLGVPAQDAFGRKVRGPSSIDTPPVATASGLSRHPTTLPLPTRSTGPLPPLPAAGHSTGPLPELGAPIRRRAESIEPQTVPESPFDFAMPDPSPVRPLTHPLPLIDAPGAPPMVAGRGISGVMATLRYTAEFASPPPTMVLPSTPPPAMVMPSTPPPAMVMPSTPPPSVAPPRATPLPFSVDYERLAIEATILGVEGRCTMLSRKIRGMLPAETSVAEVEQLANGGTPPTSRHQARPADRLRVAQSRLTALETVIDDLRCGTIAPADRSAWRATPIPRRQLNRASLTTRISLDSGSNFMVGLTRNLSQGGIFVATMRCPPVGTEVDLRFEVLGLQVTAKGRVCWSLPPERCCEDAQPGVGVEFTQLSARDRATIDWFMDQYREPMHLIGA